MQPNALKAIYLCGHGELLFFLHPELPNLTSNAAGHQCACRSCSLSDKSVHELNTLTPSIHIAKLVLKIHCQRIGKPLCCDIVSRRSDGSLDV